MLNSYKKIAMKSNSCQAEAKWAALVKNSGVSFYNLCQYLLKGNWLEIQELSVCKNPVENCLQVSLDTVLCFQFKNWNVKKA